MKIHFTKMHGAGNDYIYINCLNGILADPADLAVKMSPRHLSVGADGVVLICPSTVADARMRMFNADGSEGKMCGNAIRCVGKYLYDNGICKKETITVETLSGIKTLRLFVGNGKVDSVEVDMGVAQIAPAAIPVLWEGERMVNEPVLVCGKEYRLTAVSMGNPHAVTFLDSVSDLPLAEMGPHFENLPIFPDRVNTEFVKVIDPRTLEMRVWERGSGETYACGTGACATTVAAILNGHCDFDTDITVRLIGGKLTIRVDRAFRVRMIGKAEKVYEGIYDYDED